MALSRGGKTAKMGKLAYENTLKAGKLTPKAGSVDSLDRFRTDARAGALEKAKAAFSGTATSGSDAMPTVADDALRGYTESTKGVKYYRVQTPGENGSMERIIINDDGSIKITTPNSSLNLSYGAPEHAQYFKALKGGDSYIVEFEVDDWFHSFIQDNAIPQENYRINPLNQGRTAPKIVDKTKPGKSMEFPPIWNPWFEEYAKNARMLE